MSSDQLHESRESYYTGQASIWQVHVYASTRVPGRPFVWSYSTGYLYNEQLAQSSDIPGVGTWLAGKNIKDVVV